MEGYIGIAILLEQMAPSARESEFSMMCELEIMTTSVPEGKKASMNSAEKEVGITAKLQWNALKLFSPR